MYVHNVFEIITDKTNMCMYVYDDDDILTLINLKKHYIVLIERYVPLLFASYDVEV